ncbi:MAG: hypothetical protein KF742_01675 [Cryobacterium sp.]|nr:hypothetical protein [Cryobacterium sp.]
MAALLREMRQTEKVCLVRRRRLRDGQPISADAVAAAPLEAKQREDDSLETNTTELSRLWRLLWGLLYTAPTGQALDDAFEESMLEECDMAITVASGPLSDDVRPSVRVALWIARSRITLRRLRRPGRVLPAAIVEESSANPRRELRLWCCEGFSQLEKLFLADEETADAFEPLELVRYRCSQLAAKLALWCENALKEVAADTEASTSIALSAVRAWRVAVLLRECVIGKKADVRYVGFGVAGDDDEVMRFERLAPALRNALLRRAARDISLGSPLAELIHKRYELVYLATLLPLGALHPDPDMHAESGVTATVVRDVETVMNATVTQEMARRHLSGLQTAGDAIQTCKISATLATARENKQQHNGNGTQLSVEAYAEDAVAVATFMALFARMVVSEESRAAPTARSGPPAPSDAFTDSYAVLWGGLCGPRAEMLFQRKPGRESLALLPLLVQLGRKLWLVADTSAAGTKRVFVCMGAATALATWGTLSKAIHGGKTENGQDMPDVAELARA